MKNCQITALFIPAYAPTGKHKYGAGRARHKKQRSVCIKYRFILEIPGLPLYMKPKKHERMIKGDQER
jgi:hypothetical protein